MSLDVYLQGEPKTVDCACAKCGHVHKNEEEAEYSWANITHNLNEMASDAGFYEAVWRPENIGIERASQLIEPLEKGIALLKSDPARFKKFDAPNGWGKYDDFVSWLEKYLSACREYPEAKVRASR